MSEQTASESAASDPTASVERVGAAAFFAQRRTIFTVLTVPAALILIVVSVILFGGASHTVHTGSVPALESTAVEYLRLQGVDVSHVEVAGSISTVDPRWGEFLAQPTTPSAALHFQSAYGFAHFENTQIAIPGHTNEVLNFEWVVVAIGTANVGCAGTAASRVPTNVITGFHLTCQ